MRTAHHRATYTLGVTAGPESRDAWGWQGRTLSRSVTYHNGLAWLRLASTPRGNDQHIFWTGAVAAHTAIPAVVPRPCLHTWHEWHDDEWQYRAELYEQIPMRPAAASAVLYKELDLPARWWEAVRNALDSIATVTTFRYTTTQQYLDTAMPRFLGTPIRTEVRGWATAHGDFHLANIFGPSLTIIDWEGWGLAPTGYDAAMLHTYSLLVPHTSTRIRSELRHLLDTPNGRFAELAVITELLHAITRGAHVGLAPRLRERAAHLLERPVPPN